MLATRATNRLDDARARAKHSTTLNTELKPALAVLVQKHSADLPQTKDIAEKHVAEVEAELARRPKGDDRADLNKITASLTSLKIALDAAAKFDSELVKLDEAIARVKPGSAPAQQILIDNIRALGLKSADNAMKKGKTAGTVVQTLTGIVANIEEYNTKLAQADVEFNRVKQLSAEPVQKLLDAQRHETVEAAGQALQKKESAAETVKTLVTYVGLAEAFNTSLAQVETRFAEVKKASKPAQQKLLDAQMQATLTAADEALKVGQSADAAVKALDNYIGEVKAFNTTVAQLEARQVKVKQACTAALKLADKKQKLQFETVDKDLKILKFESATLVVPPALIERLAAHEQVCKNAAACFELQPKVEKAAHAVCNSLPQEVKSKLELNFEQRFTDIELTQKANFAKGLEMMEQLEKDCKTMQAVIPKLKEVEKQFQEVPAEARPAMNQKYTESIATARRCLLNANGEGVSASVTEAETLVSSFKDYGADFAAFHKVYKPIHAAAPTKVQRTLEGWVSAADAAGPEERRNGGQGRPGQPGRPGRRRREVQRRVGPRR